MAFSPEVTPSSGSASGPATWNEALLTELQALRPEVFQDMHAEGFAAAPDRKAANLRELYQQIGNLAPAEQHDAPAPRQVLSALCFSGGGIRSATFNLGVIQGLARLGLLGQFDYLSSVSGGGYIASWLRIWIHREGRQQVLQTLVQSPQERQANPLAPEPKPIDNLREYSNYLTPRLGVFSADTWTGAAIVVRNLLLNWLVILPLLAVLVSIPQLCFLVVQSADFDATEGLLLLIMALLVELGASGTIYWFRRFMTSPTTPQRTFVIGCVLPLYLATVLLSMAALGFQKPSLRALWLFALLWCMVVPLLGWTVSELRRRALARKAVAPGAPYAWPGYEMLALMLSGALSAGLLVTLARTWLPYFYEYPALYVICAVPTLLGIYLLARTIFVAFASLSEGWRGDTRPASSDDADREWWARFSGWVLLLAFVWMAVSALCILGGYALEQFKALYLPHVLSAVGGIAGLVASLLGMGSDTASTNESSPQPVSALKHGVMSAAAPLCILLLMILLARGTALLGGVVTGERQALMLVLSGDLKRHPASPLSLDDCLWFLTMPLGLTVLALVMGRVVNVNRFSLHGVYRNRLIRAYLGASNTQRQPHPFTGFDPHDNPRLHTLWHATGDATRPLPVINATLNLVRGAEKLAWQQRQSESFSMTPFYCGNFYEGYRPAAEYGGAGGISVGTAVAISGAAANPNMGSSSSSVIGFLMALFNARLGAWLGNTNAHGNTTHRFAGPRQAIFPLLAELFGLTSARSRYINLSDGGHFDNLGLYEMVLRRCRFIVISDAGQDPAVTFADLGNVIRKIRIDFAIPIAFTHKIHILPRRAAEVGLYCATATIDYRAADGHGVENGHIVYLKPALNGRGQPIPYDVYSYAQAAPDFPHESTADQWFSEAQFESYRALGLHMIEQIAQGQQATDFATFMKLVQTYMESA